MQTDQIMMVHMLNATCEVYFIKCLYFGQTKSTW